MFYNITEEADRIPVDGEDTSGDDMEIYVGGPDATDEEIVQLEEQALLQEYLPMSDANRKKLDEIHEKAKKDPKLGARLMANIFKEKDPEKLIPFMPSAKKIIRLLTLGGGYVTLPVNLLLTKQENLKYVPQYISIYKSEVKVLENKISKTKDEEEKKQYRRLLDDYKDAIYRLEQYKKKTWYGGKLKEDSEVFEPIPDGDEELIREFRALKEDSDFMKLTKNPFHSFTEQNVLIMAREMKGAKVYFVRECDVSAVKNHYCDNGEDCSHGDAIEKIASVNDIDTGNIVVIDENFDRYRMEMSLVENRMLTEEDCEKKEELTEALIVLASEEQKRRDSMRLARIAEESLFDILS